MPDGLWRDVLAFTWTIQTMSGRAAIAATLRETLARIAPRKLSYSREADAAALGHVAPARKRSKRCSHSKPRSAAAPAFSASRPIPHGLRAWTIVTTLEELRGHEEAFRVRPEPDSTRDFGAENWTDRLSKARAYDDRDPAVLVVGGGQAGLSIAARLHQLGIDALIVDRHKRIGDNWRTRYHSLTLHNEVHVNHLPYLPFPPTFPVYIPKDKLANWFESYVEAMELNFWTGTELVAGTL